MKWLKGFLITIQFFTAVPINKELPMDQQHLKTAVQSFPLLGLCQGILYSVLLCLLVEWTPFSQLAVAFILWLTTILLTGGIHLDGWIDASDAYFSYRDPEKRLEIMKDPRTGAFGVLSVIILLSGRFVFIYEIIDNLTLTQYILIAAIPFLSKSVMGVLLLTVQSAKREGLGYLFQRAAPRKVLSIYPLYIIIFLLLVWSYHGEVLEIGILIVAGVGSYFFCRLKAMKWFGGITGDVLGASVEGTELMLWLILWLLHYFVMV